MSDTVILKVNGFEYRGWLSVEIKRSMKAICGMFTLSVTDSWQRQKKPWIIIPGDYCEVFIGEELLISGYIDDIDYSSNATGRKITVTGRDKTADLVDCSVEQTQSEWSGVTLEDLLRKFLAPFKINLINESGINPKIDKFRINQGAKVIDVISELSKKYGFIASSNPKGEFVIVSVGKGTASDWLEEGTNCIDFGVKFDHKERFSKYAFKGQSSGSDNFFGKAASSPIKTSTDDQVKRYRPLVLTDESKSNEENLEKRAEWEKNLRAAKSTAGSVKVRGWRQRKGELWKENLFVNVRSNYLGLETKLLISDITYILSESGKTVDLELMREDVFLAEFENISGKMKKKKGEKKTDPWDALKKDFFDNSEDD